MKVVSSLYTSRKVEISHYALILTNAIMSQIKNGSFTKSLRLAKSRYPTQFLPE